MPFGRLVTQPPGSPPPPQPSSDGVLGVTAIASALSLGLTFLWSIPGLMVMLMFREGMLSVGFSDNYTFDPSNSLPFLLPILPNVIGGFFFAAMGLASARLLYRHAPYRRVALIVSGLVLAYVAMVPVFLPYAPRFISAVELPGCLAGYAAIAFANERAMAWIRIIGGVVLVGLAGMWLFSGAPVMRATPLPATLKSTFHRVPTGLAGQEGRENMGPKPGSLESYWGRFYSIELAPIDVTLKPRGRDGVPAELHLARAAVTAATGFDYVQQPRLPQDVSTDRLQLVIALPDGQPYIVAAKQFATDNHKSDIQGIQLIAARRIDVTLVAQSPDDLRKKIAIETTTLQPIDAFDGITHFVKNGQDLYLGSEGKDGFAEITCSPIQMHDHACSATIPLPPAMMATVRIPDFREQGGRSYANNVARVVHDVACHAASPSCR